MVKHLSDEELQLFVIDRQQCAASIVEHIHVCEECKVKAEVYRSLITGIEQQPAPSFDFDLATLIVEQLPAPKQKMSDRSLLWTLIFVGVALAGAAAYYFRVSFSYLFTGISTILIYLMVISVVTILVAVFIDMYKKYNKEMKLLDSF